jgi:hypothetical protein
MCAEGDTKYENWPAGGTPAPCIDRPVAIVGVPDIIRLPADGGLSGTASNADDVPDSKCGGRWKPTGVAAALEGDGYSQGVDVIITCCCGGCGTG